MRRVRVRSQAFDSNEPIELTYDSESDSYSALSYGVASAYDAAAYEDKDEAYEASAFDYDEESYEASAFDYDEDEDYDEDAEAYEASAFDYDEDEDEDYDKDEAYEASAFDYDEDKDYDEDGDYEASAFDYDEDDYDEDGDYEASAFDYDEDEDDYDEDDDYEASAFDYDEDEDDYDEDGDYGAIAFDYDEDEAGAFEVESFESEDDASTSQHNRLGQSFAALDLDEETLAEDLDFSDLDAALDAEKTSQALSETDFARDLQAIIKGEKTYNKGRGGMVSTQEDDWATAQSHAVAPDAPPAIEESTNPHEVFSQMAQHMPHNQLGSAPLAQASQVTEAEPTPHDVFNRMGHNMSYANSFDLGSISLQQRFDELDDMLDREGRAESTAKSIPRGQDARLEGNSTSFALDEAALADDLALMHEAMQADDEAEVSKPDEQETTPEINQETVEEEKPKPGQSEQEE